MMRFEDLEVWKRAARLSADMLSGLIKTKKDFLKKKKDQRIKGATWRTPESAARRRLVQLRVVFAGQAAHSERTARVFCSGGCLGSV